MAPVHKRKSASETSRTAPKRQRTNKAVPKKPQASSRLLGLPAELRNAIWELAITDVGVVRLPKKKEGHLAIQTPLIMVSKQVRDEVEGVAMWTSPVIEATVLNFNFCQLIAYLNRLSELDLKRLSSQSGSIPIQKFQVWLEFRGENRANVELLGRWVRRAARPDKNGTNIRFSYKSTAARPEDHFPSSANIWNIFCRIKRVPGNGQRSEQEADAIRMALSEGVKLARTAVAGGAGRSPWWGFEVGV